jgi:RNA polymerase sigma-70 factor (ECF subfamily)
VGDRRHLEQRYRLLFEQHWRPVLAYALRRAPDAATADDVVAEVFLTAWRRIGDIPQERELPWLYGVARNVLLNTRRSHVRRERLVGKLQGDRTVHPPGHASPPAADEDQLEELWLALGRLKEEESEILRLANWERLSHAEIAVVLSCSPNAVGIKLHRARVKLAEMLMPHQDNRAGGSDDEPHSLNRHQS